jgi:hypothetical protein
MATEPGRRGGLFGGVGRVVGMVASGLKANETSTTLLLIDNRSGVPLAAAGGSAKNFDFSLFGAGPAAACSEAPAGIPIRRRERS